MIMHARLTPPPSSPRHFSPAREAHRDPPLSPYPQNLKHVYQNELPNVLTPAEKGRGRDGEDYPKDCSEDHVARTVSLPPIVHRLATCAKRARSKFTPYNKPPVPSALELRFTEKSLGRVDSSEITLDDARKGKSILLRGLMGLSDKAVRQALAAGQADREAKRLRALTTAWEIEAADRRRDFLLMLHNQEIQRFNWAADEVALFEKILERGSIEDLEDNMDFNIGAYSYDLRSLAVADERLDQMGVEVTRRTLGDELSVEEDETPDRLNAILTAALLASSDETDKGVDSNDGVRSQGSSLSSE